MKTRNITTEEALELSKKSEDHFFDRKSSSVSGKMLQKIVVALANADGGEVLVGIADDRDEPDPANRWNGFRNIEALNGLLQAIFTLNPSIDLHYEVLTSKFPGYVLRVQIEKSSQVHKTSDGTVYVRNGAQSLPLSDPQRIVELTFAKGASSFEDKVLSAAPAELVVESPS
jgi:ATP-dependent DNA helicase RecG